MTSADITEFYRRLNRELEHRTERKLLERELRDCRASIDRHLRFNRLDLGARVRKDEIERRLKEISF